MIFNLILFTIILYLLIPRTAKGCAGCLITITLTILACYACLPLLF